ncbi:DNA polymerase III subunit gamma and tau [Modestobacter sp. VKM Ac-2979]|uniref:DNA polymerase III subunit gamma and tau n=1 Tax=unclassified Modestobacter TaxID=2643866 RepID=UPI0022AB832F|nr:MULTISPECIES: DNA polymerase III subunit gamma and tau [unclassified Modestobacter]MCZ2813489.1 DNA polymerase III subunit gamma and tau [Modestobacter sp. VKM Ac-2979]MCZ2842319.1 DNA polymerase III subunit gamma and tau [Modestobacter sp. VKM Ac-2980]
MALALYRKYRPATFAEVVGQEHVTAPLMNAVDGGRINHAYLFSGPRGCGKTSSARILARSLNCEQGPTSTPCGVCGSCIALAPDGPGSIDVMEIDAASHGGVDDARDLREKAFFAPVHSRYKVYIVDEAHMVSSQGFNALLKVVEEPPEFLVFVFATTEPEKVLPTIRSRTHHYPFRLVPPSTLRGLLERTCEAEGVTVEPTVFPLVVRAGGGSVRDSLSILDQLLAGAGPEGVTYRSAVGLLGVTDEALLDEAVDALAASDAPGVFQAVDRVVEAGHDPRRFATDLLDRLRDLIVLDAVPEAGGNGLLDSPPDRLDVMSRQAQALGSATLSRLADTVHEGLTEMRGTTAPRLLLELVCARMLLPGVDGSATATLQRLERLERRMSIAGEHAGRPEAAAVPAPVREPARPAPAQAPPAPAQAPPAPAQATPTQAPAQPPAAEPAAPPAAAQPSRPAYVRPSQARSAPATPTPAPASPPAPEGDDGWPVTARPGAPAPAPSSSRPPAAEPPRPRSEGSSASEVPLPPEPTDDEDWPQPSRPAAPEPRRATTPDADAAPAPAPGAAAESAPAPRGGEPTPLVSATPEEPAGDDGALTTADVRRIWPELLKVVRGHKRTTEALLKSAQVHDLTNGVLTLAATSPALAKMLGDDLNKDVIRQSLEELLGVRWKVQAVVEGGPGQPGGAGGRPGGAPVSPEAARAAVQAAESAEADELMAERAADADSGGAADNAPALDPEAAALQLLRTQLGARPIDS